MAHVDRCVAGGIPVLAAFSLTIPSVFGLSKAASKVLGSLMHHRKQENTKLSAMAEGTVICFLGYLLILRYEIFNTSNNQTA